MKVLMAGEANVHLRNYCSAISPFLGKLAVITEDSTGAPSGMPSHVVNFRSVNPLTWWSAYRSIRKVLKDMRPDIVHLHQINRLAFVTALAAARSGIPIVTTAWGSDVLLVPERSYFHKRLVSFVINKSAVITADARVMIDAMMRMVPQPDKYVFLQYGIDPVAKSDKENIIFSNRLHRPLYNIDTVLNDFAVFHEKHPDWRLVVGGSGPETENLKLQAERRGIMNVTEFTGWLDKAANEMNYARASIYVSIPSSDGTSVSLLEAMSAGCVPVVSDLPVTAEWIKDGVNGIIRKQTTNPFEEAITIDKDRCMQVNLQLIGTEVDRKETTRRFASIYQNVLNRS